MRCVRSTRGSRCACRCGSAGAPRPPAASGSPTPRRPGGGGGGPGGGPRGGAATAVRTPPRGVGARCAAPAIPAGMTGAALATGNAVVLKPAEQSPGCGFELVRALREAGVPPDALALAPGEGDAGAALVRHPGVHVIAFTGSAAVGLEIVEAAPRTAPGQRH